MQVAHRGVILMDNALPLGRSNFAALRTRDEIYVDEVLRYFNDAVDAIDYARYPIVNEAS